MRAGARLSGFGVELAIKSTEYKARDDAIVAPAASGYQSAQVHRPEDNLRGFNFTRLLYATVHCILMYFSSSALYHTLQLQCSFVHTCSLLLSSLLAIREKHVELASELEDLKLHVKESVKEMPALKVWQLQGTRCFHKIQYS